MTPLSLFCNKKKHQLAEFAIFKSTNNTLKSYQKEKSIIAVQSSKFRTIFFVSKKNFSREAIVDFPH